LTRYDLLIVGGGPAGLSAALYAGRARLRTVLLEKAFCGGQARYTDQIENYPGFPHGITGPQLMDQMESQARQFGVEIQLGEAQGLRREGKTYVVDTSMGSLKAPAVIIASGARPNQLGIPGEREFLGRGVSYCATCDGAFFRDKDVAVIGGGDSAVKEALFLTRFARKVYLIHRRDRLRATEILQERVLDHPQIEILWNKVPLRVTGDQLVHGLLLGDPTGGSQEELKIQGLFIYIGNTPDTDWLGGQVQLDEEGYVITDGHLATDQRGVFAAGDVRTTPLRQVVTAVGDGAVAAVEAEKYLVELGEK
jgi:thioredoxin reductase (NADPH)